MPILNIESQAHLAYPHVSAIPFSTMLQRVSEHLDPTGHSSVMIDNE